MSEIQTVSFIVTTGVNRNYSMEAAVKQLNEWINLKRNELQVVKVINVETIQCDGSSFGPYQPVDAGIRVWYTIEGA